MPEMTFQLHPFAPVKKGDAVAVQGKIRRQAHQVSLSFVLSGALDELAIPNPSEHPERTTGLWEATCFEFFFGVQGLSPYWEVNLSPSGDWNIFRFSDYRKNMTEETAVSPPAVDVVRCPERLELMTELHLGNILKKNQPLQAGASAVLQTMDGALSFWALAHPGPRPDFHRRDGFLLNL